MSVLLDLIQEDFELESEGRFRKCVDQLRDSSSLVYDSEKDIFYWNSKDIAGDAFTWLTKVKGYSKSAAIDRLSSHVGFSEVYVNSIQNSRDVVVLPRLVDAFWEGGLNSRDYWYDRGILDSTIDRFRLGYHNGWYTIPIFVDGLLRNFQIRRDLPEKRIKNWYSGVGPIMFNSVVLNIMDSVVIAEGPTDCILLNQEGIPSVSHNGGSTGWRPEWNRRFYNCKRIFIAYDHDDAGYTGARKIANSLGEYRCKIIDWSILGEDLPKGYDVGRFFLDGASSADFDKLLKEGSKHVFEF